MLFSSLCLADSRSHSQSPRMDHSAHPGIHGLGAVGALHSHCTVDQRQKMAALSKLPNILKCQMIRGFIVVASSISCAEDALWPRNGHNAPNLFPPFFPHSLAERTNERTSLENFILPLIRRHSVALWPRARRPPIRRRPAAARNPFSAAPAKSLPGRSRRVFANRPNAVVFLVVFCGGVGSKWT